MAQGHSGGKDKQEQGSRQAIVGVEAAVQEHGPKIHVKQSVQASVVGHRCPPGFLSITNQSFSFENAAKRGSK